MKLNLAEIKHRHYMPEFLNDNGLTGVGAEIGVFEGGYSWMFVEKWNGHHFYGIDPFENLPQEQWHDGCNRCDLKNVMENTIKRFAGIEKYSLVIRSSEKALSSFDDNTLDFIHIDGNHEYEAAKFDISHWWTKVKPGGIFSGHDFYDRDDDGMRCGVAKAVIEFSQRIQAPFTVLPCTTWVFQKP